MVVMSPGQAPQVFYPKSQGGDCESVFPHLLKSSQDWDRQPAFGEQAQAHRVPTICLTIIMTTDTGHRLFQMRRRHRPAERPPPWVTFQRLPECPPGFPGAPSLGHESPLPTAGLAVQQPPYSQNPTVPQPQPTSTANCLQRPQGAGAWKLACRRVAWDADWPTSQGPLRSLPNSWAQTEPHPRQRRGQTQGSRPRGPAGVSGAH